jgi:hypothetical protein
MFSSLSEHMPGEWSVALMLISPETPNFSTFFFGYGFFFIVLAGSN